jgi:hypothetical protein
MDDDRTPDDKQADEAEARDATDDEPWPDPGPWRDTPWHYPDQPPWLNRDERKTR